MCDNTESNKHTHRCPPLLEPSLFTFAFLHLQLELGLRQLHLGRCGVIHEPYELAGGHRSYTRSR